MKMVVPDFATLDTVPSVLALSKATWKLGIALAALDENIETIGFTVNDLTGEVKSLGNVCDQLYSLLEEVTAKSEASFILPPDLDNRLWNCLATQVDETSHAIQELELFVKIVRGEETRFIGQAQRLKKLDKSKNRLASSRTRIGRHTESLRVTTHLINTIRKLFRPNQAQRESLGALNKLQDMVNSLSESEPQAQLSQTEVRLIQCAHEVIEKGTAMYETSRATERNIKELRQPHNTGVKCWMRTLEAIRGKPCPSNRSDPSVDLHSTQQTTGTTRSSGRGSDDDLHTDIAKAALETGTKAFDAREWDEASSLLEEALVVLEQLMPHQRNFCDLLSLQYRLSICTYYTHEPEQAEEALLDLVKQSTSTEQQQEYVLSATHLLAQIHIRNGELERARSECETALQGRRRLMGKHSDASLESLALMAHIYVLLNKRALAKSCLAMIPEKRRDAVLTAVEVSLGPAVEHLDFASLLTPLVPGESPNPAAETQSICSGVSGSTVGLGMDKTIFDYGSAGANSPAASPRPSTPSLASPESPRSLLHSHVMVPSSLRNINEPTRIGKERPVEQNVTVSNQDTTPASSTYTSPQIAQIRRTDPASRKAILDKMGCQPRDRIEEVVCAGDHVALVYLLTKKKGFWRSSLRKRGRPERVTALHFAALLGEIDMARRLLDASYNVNEVPFGYSTSLTPLNFAVGARQADMVDFLIANGARPSESESWSTLAGQLLSRSWLAKTMCDAEKDLASTRITATMSILIKHGWTVTEPIDQSGKTALHQAVSFWTGEYRWDMDVRTAVTTFLCERGANPFQADAEGKTPYDLALASGHQDLLGILEQEPQRRELHGGMGLVELPERPH